MADIQQATFSAIRSLPGCFMVFQTAHYRHARSIGAEASAAERRGVSERRFFGKERVCIKAQSRSESAMAVG
jgi:hypothetical protein